MSHRGAENTSLSRALLGVAFYIAILLIFGALGWEIFAEQQEANAGISYGEPLEDPWASVYPLGVNVALEQYDLATLRTTIYPLIKQGGFRWIRQTFTWAEIEPQPGQFNWEPWDLIVDTYAPSGASLVAVLDTSPAWARDEDYPQAPPRDFEDYFRFVRVFAERYGERIDFYEIWDEPNIYPHWGERFVDSRGYTNLLRGAYQAIKEIDPQAVILNAGLAPNIEAGGKNMSDIQFLEEMYRAGARDFFDILAIQPYGFWGEADGPADLEITNFSRTLLLRDVMLTYRDGEKPVWAVEFGWNSLPENWAGAPSPWSSDREEVQAARTIAALERAMDEWPWMGAMILMHLQPDAPADDPMWGFAILNADFSLRLIYREVAEWAEDSPLFPGSYQLDVVPGTVTIKFKGTRLELTIHPPFHAEVKVDDKSYPPISLLEGTGERRITIVTGLPYAEHTLQLTPEHGDVQVIGIVIRRDFGLTPIYLSLGLIAGTGLVITWRLSRVLLSPPVLSLGKRLSRPFVDLPDLAQGALLGVVVIVYYDSPWLPISILALAIAFSLIYLRPDWGLFYIVLTIPFYLLPKEILGKHFASVEILTLVTFTAWLLRGWVSTYLKQGFLVSLTLSGLVSRLRDRIVDGVRALSAPDWAVLFFLGVSVVSLWVSENLTVSLREFRVVILEPVIFYWLLTRMPLDETKISRLVQAVLVSAVLLSLIGLFQYFFTDQVITAEGVRRIHAFYGSPNNLALFLGRALPLALAFLIFGAESKKRWSYLLSAVAIGLALFLTYSRGALFLGVPASVLFLAWFKGRRTFVVALGVMFLALLLLVPLTGTERFASLLDLESGTGFLRLQLWESTLDMIRDHPLFGVGLDNFLYQYPRYIKPGAWPEPDLSHPHNFLLHWWVSLGIAGVVTFLWMVIGFFRSGFRLLQSHALTESQWVIVIGLMASMVAGLAHGLVDQSYFLVDLAFLFFLSLGIVRGMASDKDPGPWISNPGPEERPYH
ncbi:MAG: O-antigen ligase family protein [Chloroflexi bacterium]|nr:O-antigen ligase family protein [Chloroflexota bacterium]